MKILNANTANSLISPRGLSGEGFIRKGGLINFLKILDSQLSICYFKIEKNIHIVQFIHY